MKLRKLWKIKKMCEKSVCNGCIFIKMKKDYCSAKNLNENNPYTTPNDWKLPSLPKKFEDRFILAENREAIPRANKAIRKALNKGYAGIKCYVWNFEGEEKGTDVIIAYRNNNNNFRYLGKSGLWFRHAEPVQKEECSYPIPGTYKTTLPKKFKDKFTLGEKHKIKINKKILESITKKRRAIKCYVWDDCRTAAAKTWVYGIFLHGTHPYVILNGQKFKHAEPIPREEK